MLPSLVGRNVIEGIKSYLKTTFPPSIPAFRNTLEAFLDEPGRVFKGPYPVSCPAGSGFSPVAAIRFRRQSGRLSDPSIPVVVRLNPILFT